MSSQHPIFITPPLLLFSPQVKNSIRWCFSALAFLSLLLLWFVTISQESHIITSKRRVLLRRCVLWRGRRALERLLSVDGCRVNGISECVSTKCRVRGEGTTCDCNANKCLLSFLVNALIQSHAFSPSARWQGFLVVRPCVISRSLKGATLYTKKTPKLSKVE